MTKEEKKDQPKRQWRDQDRANYAYQQVADVPGGDFKSYRTTIHSLGATILRSGLAATMSDLERRGANDKSVKKVLEQLSGAKIPGLSSPTWKDLPEKVRELDVAAYMLATREALQVLLWLKRAVQARDAAEPATAVEN